MEDISGVFEGLLADLINFIPNLVVSLLIFVFSLFMAGWLSHVLDRWLKRRSVDLELSNLLEKIARWTIYILGTTMALNQVGFNLTAFLAGIGILGFTVGFALQDVSKNFVAGLLLLLERPFNIGDTIEVHGFRGVVLDVQLRATEMRALDGLFVQIPNADVFTSPIVNFTRAPRRRISLAVGIAHGADLETARLSALEAVRSVKGVVEDPAPQLVYDNFGDSSIDFTLYYWIDTAGTDYLTAQDSGVVAVKRAFSEAGIEIPFPVQTVINK